MALSYDERQIVAVAEMLAWVQARVALMHPAEIEKVMDIFGNYMPTSDHGRLECEAFEHLMSALRCYRDDA